MVARPVLAAVGGAALAHAAVNPQVQSTTLWGPAIDPSLDRDSCGSVPWDAGRLLWTCRDTQDLQSDGLPSLALYSSSASYTNFTSDGSIAWTPIPANSFNYTDELLMYGDNNDLAFFPLQADECDDNQAGGCPDGTRFALWPDSPPMVADRDADDGSITAYTWIRKEQITSTLGTVVTDPATSLYRVSWSPSVEGSGSSTLPAVDLVNEEFWAQGEFAYGDYGNVVVDGTAYLFAKSDEGTTALAMVPAAGVEDQTQYQYWVDDAWTSTQPGINQTGVQVNATAGGQGTFYFSDAWESYVWIGQPGDSIAPEFWITTAPAPSGPWIAPQLVLTVQDGNYSLGAYSMQAHPGLSASSSVNEIYVSYTKNDLVDGDNIYTTPITQIVWAD